VDYFTMNFISVQPLRVCPASESRRHSSAASHSEQVCLVREEQLQSGEGELSMEEPQAGHGESQRNV